MLIASALSISSSDKSAYSCMTSFSAASCSSPLFYCLCRFQNTFFQINCFNFLQNFIFVIGIPKILECTMSIVHGRLAFSHCETREDHPRFQNIYTVFNRISRRANEIGVCASHRSITSLIARPVILHDTSFHRRRAIKEVRLYMVIPANTLNYYILKENLYSIHDSPNKRSPNLEENSNRKPKHKK